MTGSIPFSVDRETAKKWERLLAWDTQPAPPRYVPQTISPLQARRALRQLGVMDTITTFMESRPEVEQDAWEYCVEVRRDDPIIQGAAAILGLTSAQIDQLFILGARL